MSSGRKFPKPLLAALGLAGTAASIWWFALKPRRKRAKAGSEQSSSSS